VAVAVRRARDEERPGIMRLRHAVFCEEQGVPPELEHDGLDATAIHLVALQGGEVVGTCRLIPEGRVVRLGRMAVAASHRGRGIGADLLRVAHEAAREEGGAEVAIHAQLAVRRFWERAGYAGEGAPFEEAGIAHIAMRRPLAP
jgi:predicted GNAT family N-acyltransferase